MLGSLRNPSMFTYGNNVNCSLYLGLFPTDWEWRTLALCNGSTFAFHILILLKSSKIAVKYIYTNHINYTDVYRINTILVMIHMASHRIFQTPFRLVGNLAHNLPSNHHIEYADCWLHLLLHLCQFYEYFIEMLTQVHLLVQMM